MYACQKICDIFCLFILLFFHCSEDNMFRIEPAEQMVAMCPSHQRKCLKATHSFPLPKYNPWDKIQNATYTNQCSSHKEKRSSLREHVAKLYSKAFLHTVKKYIYWFIYLHSCILTLVNWWIIHVIDAFSKKHRPTDLTVFFPLVI